LFSYRRVRRDRGQIVPGGLVEVKMRWTVQDADAQCVAVHPV
jgi:hypothetical protein